MTTSESRVMCTLCHLCSYSTIQTKIIRCARWVLDNRVLFFPQCPLKNHQTANYFRNYSKICLPAPQRSRQLPHNANWCKYNEKERWFSSQDIMQSWEKWTVPMFYMLGCVPVTCHVPIWSAPVMSGLSGQKPSKWNPKCPVCKEPFTIPLPCPFASARVSALDVVCIHETCEWKGTCGRLDHHLDTECECGPIKCSGEGSCGTAVPSATTSQTGPNE